MLCVDFQLRISLCFSSTQINYTEDELRTFANRAAKMATKNLQAQNSEDSNGLTFSAGGKERIEGVCVCMSERERGREREGRMEGEAPCCVSVRERQS